MPPLVLNLLPGLVAVLALAGIYGYGYHNGKTANEEAWQAKLVEQQKAALDAQQKKQEEVNGIIAKQQIEKRGIARQRDDAVAELQRHKAARLSEPARAACAGSTGEELSSPDARFLVGEAARADELRADLRACQKYIEAVRRKTQ